jgi:hypothetical protein
MLFKCAQTTIQLQICSCNSLYLTQFLLGKLTFYGRVLKSIACVALVRKAADEIRITIFFTSFGAEKINELVASNKLTNNFAALVTSGQGPDVARGSPVVLRWPKPIPCSSHLLELIISFWMPIWNSVSELVLLRKIPTKIKLQIYIIFS